jgi:magnesium transporter
MVSLIEANIDLIADALETVGSEVDRLSREVFRNKTSNATKKTRNLRSTIEQIGRKGDLLPMIRESLVSVARHVAYLWCTRGKALKDEQSYQTSGSGGGQSRAPTAV